MSKFIENDLEQAVMEWFQDLGYQTQYGPDISPGGSFSERESFGDVVLYDRLHSALKRINKQYSNDTISELVKKITRQQSLSIVQNNVAFQKLLTDGIDVEVKQKDGSIKTEKAYNKSRKNRSPRYYIWGNEPLFHIPYDNSIISYINYNIIIKYFVNSKIAKPLFHETAEKRFVYSF